MAELNSDICKAIPVADKTASSYVVSAAVAFIKSLFVGRAQLVSDNEPAVKAIVGKVENELSSRLVPATVPRYSSESNGGVESCISRLEGQFRTLRLDLECRYKARITIAHPLWSWLTKWAGFTQARFARRGTGLTAYRTQYDVEYTQEILPFGETCLMRIARPKHRRIRGSILQKGAPGWLRVVWVGRNELSGEHMGLTAEGLQQSRSVRRLPEGSQRMDATLFNSVIGLPWNIIVRQPRAMAGAPPPVATAVPVASGDDGRHQRPQIVF